jgi:hypothetical protein
MLELWAGIEATVNRVGDCYFDQLASSGHATRLDDLYRVAALGVRTVRYPVLWERTAPERNGSPDWRWADERLGLLRDLGITPIVGFVHHGSGPRYTGLLDPAFPSGLAAFARAFAARYPWITHYTPVNEPLTTARFSALYGHWYPHLRESRSFVRALVNQLRAVAMSMRAVRVFTPGAMLVQTEDIGSTCSTMPLAYQAEFENHRRWLTFDLLCGLVDHQHPLWERLRASGFTDEDAAAFRDHPCPPDIFRHQLLRHQRPVPGSPAGAVPAVPLGWERSRRVRGCRGGPGLPGRHRRARPSATSGVGPLPATRGDYGVPSRVYSRGAVAVAARSVGGSTHGAHKWRRRARDHDLVPVWRQ